MRLRCWSASLATLLLALSTASAQQFQHQPGAMPGPTVWSEGVETLDADMDGRMDVIFTNGVGFSSAGGALSPTLVMNTSAGGVPSFTDGTSGRIPAGFAQQGKGLAACDVNGDGAPDLVFANGFLTQPRILMNNGLGVFTDQTGTRFPAMSLNAFGVAAADVDDDGDIDLVFCDAGPSNFSAPGAPPRLLINDGTGIFSDSPALMNGVNKVGAMQVTAVDIDNDFDVDIIVDGRSVGQHLYLNDGTGTFSFAGASMLPVGSSFVYETDWADLDNDLDMDGFYISMSGFNEGTARNNLLPGGSLQFAGTTGTIGGLNGNDDNEAAFIDANDDGLLDVIVASLNHNREKLYLNAGTFATQSFAYQAAGFTILQDSTLDLAIADFNDDGRYDVVTAQGESGSFLNRYYANTGAQDSHGPVIGRVEPSPATVSATALLAGTTSLRAWIQDAVVDSGRTYVAATASGTITKDGIATSFSEPMCYSGGGIWRWGPCLSATPLDLVGADVTFDITATDPPGNITTSATQAFRICGTNGYGTPSAAAGLSFSATPNPTIGLTTTLSLTAGPPSQPGILALGPDRDALPFGSGAVYVDISTAQLIPITLDPSGSFLLPVPIPNSPAFVAILARLQIGAVDPTQPSGLSLSNGLELAICDS